MQVGASGILRPLIEETLAPTAVAVTHPEGHGRRSRRAQP